MSIDYDGINSVCDEARNRELLRLVAQFREQFGKEPPTHWEICHICDGDGGHSRRLGVVDPEEWGPEEFDDYLAGAYDAECERCEGTGKIRAIDEERLTPEQLKWYTDSLNEIAETNAIYRSEMMYGC